MTPSIYRTTAQRIADAIQKEPSVPHPTLTGLISDCTKKHTAEPRLKLKSLQDKIKDKPAPYNDTPARGSSNLIWNRAHPSRNTSNQAPADPRRFNQHSTMSTKRTHQQLQHPTSTPTPHPRFTPPRHHSTPTAHSTPYSNIYLSTSVNQPQERESAATLNASNEPARKRGRNHSGNRRGMS